MRTGTNRRTHGPPVRQERKFSGPASKFDCATSRRITVMLALRRGIGAIREYLDDSSSKRPASSVSSTARGP